MSPELKPAPLPEYTADHVTFAYQLRYNWAGWPSNSTFPPEPDKLFFTRLEQAWESDGIRLLERKWAQDEIRILASVLPWVSPIDFAGRVKGRLQHALRKNQTQAKFSRKLAVCTVGEMQRMTVEKYIENQVAHEGFADARFEAFLQQFTVVDDTVDLVEPTRSRSGRYWYNLHLVLVVRDRFRIMDAGRLGKLRDGSLRIAELKGHRISRLSVMPDHLHVALRANIDHSPEEVALSYMNNLSFLIRQPALWQPSYYVGGFGEYHMGAIR
jgi:REP element-mobilizing transposase RayT